MCVCVCVSSPRARARACTRAWRGRCGHAGTWRRRGRLSRDQGLGRDRHGARAGSSASHGPGCLDDSEIHRGFPSPLRAAKAACAHAGRGLAPEQRARRVKWVAGGVGGGGGRGAEGGATAAGCHSFTAAIVVSRRRITRRDRVRDGVPFGLVSLEVADTVSSRRAADGGDGAACAGMAVQALYESLNSHLGGNEASRAPGWPSAGLGSAGGRRAGDWPPANRSLQ